ncbi:DUF58 domain-containing protein [Thalassotalea sediminis]|uniref:DUF58 domain-containing protein n=1 Tax=Thalassotalea sediminis TaxID=1759089 RepID=UPI0025739321|nr:DUF58 domain-containing protein [Thalassotalea sediminis]
MLNSLKHTLNRRFFAFVDNRIKVKKSHQLTHKTIYILPTLFGSSFMGFIVLLFILGTNYQNNLILFVCYLLSSLFIVVMLHSFQNLLGIKVSCKGEFYTQVDQALDVSLNISSQHKLYAVSYFFADQQSDFCSIVDGDSTLKSKVFYDQRGVHSLARFTLKSEFPLGLFRTWTHIRFPVSVVVYPKPLVCQVADLSPMLSDDDNGQSALPEFDGDDFFALTPYQQGWPLSRVAWKNVAKGQAWQIKQTARTVRHDDLVLRLADMPASLLENKLKQLCYLVLDLTQGQQSFAVELDKRKIATNKGVKHTQQCLHAIATYNQQTSVHSSQAQVERSEL